MKDDKPSSGYTIPQGYLEELKQRVLADTVDKNKTPRIHWWRGRSLSIAASLFILAAAFWLFKHNTTPDVPSSMEYEMFAYMLDNPDAIYLEEEDDNASLIALAELMNELDQELAE